jgi:outer membrane receptor protein involved in Fe transport
MLKTSKAMLYTLGILIISITGIRADRHSDSIQKTLQSGDIPFNISSLSLDKLFNFKVNIATKTSIPLSHVPAAITIISKEQIENTPARDLADLIEIYVPGALFTLHDGPRIGMRGIIIDRNYKILLLVNGKVMNEHVMDGVATEISNWDMHDIERVEIIRGPGSVTYGPGAIAGVIHIITKKGSVSKGLGIKIGTDPNISYRSNGGYLEYQQSRDNIRAYFYGSVRTTKGDADPEMFQVAPQNRNDLIGYVNKDYAYKDFQQASGYAGVGWKYADSLVPEYADLTRPQIKSHLDLQFGRDWRVWARYTSVQTIGHFGGVLSAPYKYVDGSECGRFFDRQAITGQFEYNKDLTDFYNIRASVSGNVYEMVVNDVQDTAYGRASGYARQGNVSYGGVNLKGNNIFNAAEKTAQLEIHNHFIFWNKYALAAGYSLTYDRMSKSDFYGDYLDLGPALQLQNDTSTRTADDLFLQNKIPKKMITYYNGIFAEANVPLHKYATLLLSGRLDKHTYSDWLISPRAALISNITDNSVVKLIVQQSVRMNLLQELWESDLRGIVHDKYEKLFATELIYTGHLKEILNVNASVFYNKMDILGWKTSKVYSTGSVSTNSVVGQTALVAKDKTLGFEIESKAVFDKITAGLNHSYIHLLDFESANSNAGNGISASDMNQIILYVDSAGTKVKKPAFILRSTGNSLNNWAHNQTKMYANIKLPYNFTLSSNCSFFWKYDGIDDYITMYENAAKNPEINPQTGTPWASQEQISYITAVTDFVKKENAGRTNVMLDLFLKYQRPLNLYTFEISVYSQNILSAIDALKFRRYYHITNIAGFRMNRLAWINEPPTFGIKTSVKF